MLLEDKPPFPRFNHSIIPTARHTPKWDFNTRASAPGADARQRRQSRPYWESDLSGLLLNEKQKDAIVALQFRNHGNVEPVLLYLSAFGEIGTVTGRDPIGYPIVEPQVIGIGTGVAAMMQLRKRLVYPEFEDEPVYCDVKFPNYGYADLLNISGNASYGMYPLTIYVNGVLLDEGDWTCDRGTGLVSLTVTGEVSAKGSFYTKMLLPAGGIPVGNDTEHGSGSYVIGDNVLLVEPPGGL